MNLEAMLPFGLTLDGAVSATAAMAAFATVFAVWNALIARDPLGARARGLRKRREELKAGLTQATRNRHRRQTANAIGMMRSITQRLDLLRTKTAANITDRLAQAGWRSKDGAVMFLFCKLALPFVFGGAAFVLFNLMGVLNLSPMLRILMPLGAVLLGAYAPDIYVKNAIQKREKALTKGLPDALDLLVICAEAGLALDAGLTRVAREMQRSSPEIADEFGLTAVELGFLAERRKAVENLARRVQLASVRGVVNTLLQTEKYGTPLAQSLRVLAAEFRNERMLKAEEKAAKLPAILTVPLIVFIMPALFIVLIGPGALRTIDALSRL